MTTKVYLVGRGSVFFASFLPGTQTPDGELNMGNCPDFKFSVKQTSLDQYSSENGIKILTDSVPIQTEYTGSFTTESITNDVVAALFLGTSDVVVTGAATGVTETLAGVKQDRTYQIGTTAAAPQGLRDIASLVVKVGATTKTPDVDYSADLSLARLYVIPGAGIANGASLGLTYNVAASTRNRVINGNAPAEGALRFVSGNVGSFATPGAYVQRDFFAPWVKLTPNGDFTLISDTWQQISFDVEILTKPGYAAVYADGRAM
jgi:hypothetical protein